MGKRLCDILEFLYLFLSMEEAVFRIVTVSLMTVLILLLMMLHIGRYGMARIYNWNGKRYCYLGYVPIQKEGSGFAIHIREHMVDLSRTTAYQICPGRAFCKKNRYKGMFVYADKSRRYLVIDKQSVKTWLPI